MSSRENSPGHENGSDRRSAEENSPSIEDSHSVREEEETRRSRSRSKSRSRSGSYSRRRRSYSRSRSRSRSRRYRRHSRSRSRSPRHRRYSRSRSRSRSYSPRHSYSPQYSPRHSSYYGRDEKYRYGSGGKGRRDYYYNRSYDRSPVSRSGRHFGNRDNPEPSRCLGVFGLSLYTQERDLRDVFGKYGAIEDVQVVYDAQSGRSRGFAFVYFEDTDDAKMAKDRCNGQEIDGRKIRVDFSITQRAHTPTPGIYMGKPTYSKYRDGGYRDRGYRGHSPYYSSRHRYSRSRSRSYDYY